MEMIFHPTLDPSSPTGVYIPSDILACFSELNLMLEANDRDIFKNTEESDLWNYHLIWVYGFATTGDYGLAHLI